MQRQPRTVSRTIVALVTLVTASSPAPAGADALKWLRGEIARLATDARIAPAKVGVLIQEIPSGRHLVQINDTAQFNVASCAKLITAATALWALGPEYKFKTVLYGARPQGREERRPPGPTLEGDLYLKGFGSPTLAERDLWQLVDELLDNGVRAVKGRIVIDESYFDDQRLAPLYDSKSTDAWYRPANGALSLSSNVVAVRVRGGEAPGDPATILMRPRSGYLRLVNKVVTVPPRRRSWVRVETRGVNDETEVTVQGRVRTGYEGGPFVRRVEDPGLLTGHALLDLLKRRGVRVARREVVRGTLPSKVRVLGAQYSEPLAVVLKEMNKHSNNFIAEQVLKVIGAEAEGPPATWQKGLQVVERYLKSVGVAPGTYTMKNGSGLYDATRFSPAQLVRVLRTSFLRFRSGADFVASLAQAAVDGTLEHRFVDSGAERYVRAKTGTLANAVTLSGYAGASKGKWPLAFSILINDLPDRRVKQAREVADAMAEAMVTYLER